MCLKSGCDRDKSYMGADQTKWLNILWDINYLCVGLNVNHNAA